MWEWCDPWGDLHTFALKPVKIGTTIPFLCHHAHKWSFTCATPDEDSDEEIRAYI